MNSENYKTETPKNPIPRLRLGTAAKVHTIIGLATSALTTLVCLIALINYVVLLIVIEAGVPSTILIIFSDLQDLIVYYPIRFAVLFCCGVLGVAFSSFAMANIIFGKKIGKPLAILVLIFSNLVAGILLCMTTEADFQKQKYSDLPEAKRGLVTVAKVYIILGFIFIGFCLLSYGASLIDLNFDFEASSFGEKFVTFVKNLPSYASNGISGIIYIFVAIISGISSRYYNLISVIINILYNTGVVFSITSLIITIIIGIVFCVAGVVFGVIAIKKMLKREYSTPIAICTLIFMTLCSGVFGLVAGILWLCAEKTNDAEIDGLNAISSEQIPTEMK